MSGSAVQRILDRVAGCRTTGDNKWIARCPAHEDRSPSLSVRELADGRVLINCFAGCGAADVLDAIGLRMADLFDKPVDHYLPRVRGGFSARELLELTAHEANMVALLACDAQRGPLTDAQLTRLMQAAGRLQRAQDMVCGR